MAALTSRHYPRILGLILSCASVLLPVVPCGAAEPSHWELGLRAGPSVNDKDESFTQLEAFVDRRLPWRWELGEDLRLGSRLSASMGQLRAGGDEGLVATFGLGLVLGEARDLQFRAGLALTGLSREVYGGEDLGLCFQFTSAAEVGYALQPGMQLHLRFQHMSNASLSDENPGVNTILAGLRFAL